MINFDEGTNEKDEENKTNLETNEEIPKRKRGRPRKELSGTEGEGASNAKKRKMEITTREPYITRSRKALDTSFADFLKVTNETDVFEFLQINDEFDQMNETKDKILHSFFANLLKVPQNYEEAIKCNERNEWRQAMNEELNSMNENCVWEIVDRPDSKSKPNIIDFKWV